jgi:DNA-binding HxlR family transcriptional regulator
VGVGEDPIGGDDDTGPPMAPPDRDDRRSGLAGGAGDDLGMAAMTAEPGASPLEHALDLVGDRWSLLLIEVLLDGPRRFGEIADAVPGIATNILADRLRRLERAAIVRSTPYQERPTRLVYALTADGAELAGALRLLADWGARQASEAETLRHRPCGTPLEARWYCPTCARAVTGDEGSDLRTL